jgi:hypothetical protein
MRTANYTGLDCKMNLIVMKELNTQQLIEFI